MKSQASVISTLLLTTGYGYVYMGSTGYELCMMKVRFRVRRDV